MLLIFKYLFRAVEQGARERRELVLEKIALRHQLGVLTRTRRRTMLQRSDRLLWSVLARVSPVWRLTSRSPSQTPSFAGIGRRGASIGAGRVAAHTRSTAHRGSARRPDPPAHP